MNLALRSESWPDVSGLPAETIAKIAVNALRLELETWPKPGLVSHVDSGSHRDMDAELFRKSAFALRPFFGMLADAGAAGASMTTLRAIGIAAEAAMMGATGGINTHRGVIFGLGLLCAAAGVCRGLPIHRGMLGRIVRRRWSEGIAGRPALSCSHGSEARRRFSIGGAPAEAAAGFPHVYNVGLTALRSGRRARPEDGEPARAQACFALIARVPDTNLLHRGGRAGLHFAQTRAADFLRAGGVSRQDWREHAEDIHREFIARNLSPGGSADLLAMSLFVDAVEAA
jgi:triphosphoribosyl-dephospho-CoA synthase